MWTNSQLLLNLTIHLYFKSKAERLDLLIYRFISLTCHFFNPQTANLTIQQREIESPSSSLLPRLGLYIWDQDRRLLSACQPERDCTFSRHPTPPAVPHTVFLVRLLPAIVKRNFMNLYINLTEPFSFFCNLVLFLEMMCPLGYTSSLFGIF